MRHLRMKIVLGGCLMAALLLTACGGQKNPEAEGTYVKPQTDLSATAPATGGQEPQESSPQDSPAQTRPSTSVIATGVAPGEALSSETAPLGSFEETDVVFHYLGRQIRVGESFDYRDFAEDWGNPQLEKAQACIGGGFDENYYFGEGLTIFTLGDSGVQVIYDISVSQEGYATEKGAVIGQTTRDQLPYIYGLPSHSMGGTDRYEWEGILVSFTFSGGLLARIDYNNTHD